MPIKIAERSFIHQNVAMQIQPPSPTNPSEATGELASLENRQTTRQKAFVLGVMVLMCVGFFRAGEAYTSAITKRLIGDFIEKKDVYFKCLETHVEDKAVCNGQSADSSGAFRALEEHQASVLFNVFGKDGLAMANADK